MPTGGQAARAVGLQTDVEGWVWGLGFGGGKRCATSDIEIDKLKLTVCFYLSWAKSAVFTTGREANLLLEETNTAVFTANTSIPRVRLLHPPFHYTPALVPYLS